MTVKGRTTERWGRYGMKLDPDVHGVRSYPGVKFQPPPEPEKTVVSLPGRLGAAEREVVVEFTGDDVVEISLRGWYRDVLTLDARQARFLRDTLTQRFPDGP